MCSNRDRTPRHALSLHSAAQFGNSFSVSTFHWLLHASSCFHTCNLHYTTSEHSNHILEKTSFTGMSIFRFRVELSLELSLRIHLCRKPWPGSMCHLGWQPSRSSASSCQRQGRRANQAECEANASRQGKSRAMPHRCECSFSNFGLQEDEGGGKTARSLPARIPP